MIVPFAGGPALAALHLSLERLDTASTKITKFLQENVRVRAIPAERRSEGGSDGFGRPPSAELRCQFI
jgi:hypothetical protein